jgi:hypothetical protein
MWLLPAFLPWPAQSLFTLLTGTTWKRLHWVNNRSAHAVYTLGGPDGRPVLSSSLSFPPGLPHARLSGVKTGLDTGCPSSCGLLVHPAKFCRPESWRGPGQILPGRQRYAWMTREQGWLWGGSSAHQGHCPSGCYGPSWGCFEGVWQLLSGPLHFTLWCC